MRVSIRTRTQLIAAIAVVAALLSVRDAHAADYVVKVGAEIQSRTGTASLICWFDHRCRGELRELGLQVDIDLPRAMSRIAKLRLRSRARGGCCFFENGRDETAIDLHAALHQEPIFKGAKELGSMTRSERLGSIYLKFRFLATDRRNDSVGSEKSI